MKKKAKIISLIVLLVCAALVGAFVLRRPLAVETWRLEPTSAALTFTERGGYTYDRQYAVYPLLAGEVIEVFVQRGDEVAAGEAIALVSASDYGYQIAQLESAIAGYQAQITDIGLQEARQKAEIAAGIEHLEAQVEILEAQMDREDRGDDSLARQIAIQQEVVSHCQAQVRIARDRLQDARDYGEDEEITLARSEYTAAQTALAQNQLVLEQLKNGEASQEILEGQRRAIEVQIGTSSRQLDASYTEGARGFYTAQVAATQASIRQLYEQAGRAEIRAPIDGVVTELPVIDQNVTSQQAPVAVLGSDRQVEVYVPLREIDAVSLGDRVELILDKRGGDEILTGTVVEIDDRAEALRSTLGVEERKVRVLIQPEGLGLRIGYDMDVRFTVGAWEDVLVAPKTAIFEKEGSDHVWAIGEDGQLSLRPVEKGAELREGYIITAGLQSGDLIVLDADNPALAPGKRAAAQ